MEPYTRAVVGYDIIERALGKDYEQDAGWLLERIREHCPGAESLLDVGCGFGRHLEAFSRALPTVEGVEPSEAMRTAARHRSPALTIHDGDMRTFRLPREFDAVVCLWGSIGYMTSASDLEIAMANLAHHLAPGGVLIVQGWYAPDRWRPGRMATHVTAEDGIGVGRLLASSLTPDGCSQMHMTYLVSEAGTVTQTYEVHTQGLFTDGEYAAAMAACGLRPLDVVPSPGSDMPLRVAVR